MAEESRSASREFQLETRHLAAIIVLIALLCVTSFMLGRWVERQTMRATAAGAIGGVDPESLAVEDVNRELTYFRTLEGDDRPPEVERPEPPPGAGPAVRQQPPPGEIASTEAEPGSKAPPGDGLMIQVMATRDLSAAVAMRQRLTQRGYRVVIEEGSGATDSGMQRVRVGPYGTRAEAERAARKIEAEERVRTWIP